MNEVPHDARPFWRSRPAIALTVFGLIALYLLFSEHREHFLGVLPFLLLLACPLMHLFMHHGHGHGHHSHSGRNNPSKPGEDHDSYR
ncbi:DUF2933 domain-containing protein [Paraburkholderia sp. J8-2]|uniref:DUF2933 domain-containing protein n=1 Tax=Paraburkholderia sp. J8-2 TaxID=2805440 RepID=UPI002AB60D89|nr:DUF2933 domain-containing protein [Paraburkholderia sp. J8-2]